MENTGFGIVNGPSKVHVGTIHKASGFGGGIPLKLKHIADDLVNFAVIHEKWLQPWLTIEE